MASQNRVAVALVLCLLAVFHQADSFRSEAPGPQEKRIGDSLRERLMEAYDCTGNKGCLGLPSGCIEDFHNTKDDENPTICVTFLSWAVEADAQVDTYKFALVGPMPADGYIAMAFSEDQRMGEDSVAGCLVSGGTPGILRFVNPNGQSGNEAHGNPQLGLKAASAGVEEGHIFCNFEQESHTIPNKINVNLRDDKYYYLLAHGTGGTPAGLHYHDAREYSSAKISVYDAGATVPTVPTDDSNSADCASISKIILGISVTLAIIILWN